MAAYCGGLNFCKKYADDIYVTYIIIRYASATRGNAILSVMVFLGCIRFADVLHIHFKFFFVGCV